VGYIGESAFAKNLLPAVELPFGATTEGDSFDDTAVITRRAR
jgi:hypothetical protein